jgi:guanylate kinase
MLSKGTVYIIAAASGTGKTSLVKVLVESLDNIMTSISYTTRPMRPGEREGESYFFVSVEEFERMIGAGEFLEYATVFGYHYGTSRLWVEQQIKKGIDIILEIDWQGAQQVKSLIPNCVSIFILPPSMLELRRRLEARNQDHEQVIKKRLAAAHEEIGHCREYDYIVVNDKFDVALVDLRSIVRSQNLTREVQIFQQQKLIAELTLPYNYLGAISANINEIIS